MACQPMHYWTFTGIVGAFLDLIIAYFLLCASTFAFFASKFLGFFGLSLPCACNGLFGIPNTNYCFQSLLVDCSIEKLSSVQLSVKSKFPFDSVLGRDQNYGVMKLDRDGNLNVVELEGEGSSSSVSDARKDLQNVVRGESVTPRNENGAIGIGNGKERKFDMKGKGVMNQRLSGGFRRRRKGGFDGGKLSPLVVNQQKAPQSHSEQNDQNDKVDNSSELVGVTSSHNEMEAPRVMKFGERALHEFGVDQPLVKNETEERISSFVQGSRNETQRQLVFDDEEKNTVKGLEQALEEEHASRAALYLELEKERNAAASAADEAMAMILRLQEEKASIEMEARQYQRIIEEKSAYDAEEMNILKEILLRREKEKHFMEKEVEAYRQMLYLGNEQSESEGEIQDTLDIQREILAPQFDLTEDPDMMLHQLNESISNKKTLRDKSAGSEVMSTVQQNISLAIAKGLPIPGWHEDSDPFISITEGNHELKEKEVVSVDDNLHSEAKEGKIFDSHLKLYMLSSSQEKNFPENSIPVVGEEQGISGECMLKKTVETGTYIGENSQNLEKHVNDASEGVKSPSSLTSDKEPDFLDVHVIDDESKLGDEFSGNKSKQMAADDPSKILRTSDLPHEAFLIRRNDAERGYPSTSRSDYEADSNKSSSDINTEPPVVGSSGRPLVPDLRRNSMNALDTERSKIDTEVEWLRERLRVVQQGREKLKVSMEHREKETLQLQLLEIIACQLREIQQLTEPRKALRQGSLPPPSSKVLSKKRRCRSVSVGLYKSS